VSELVSDVLASVRQDPVGQGVTFEVSGGPSWVHADRELTRAALLNLVLNAAQALQGRGRICVVTAPVADRMVQLQVQDSGPGIPVELREQIFEPFFTTKTRGGGLGLPIAQRTAELHGGSLTVVCPPEGGTVFTLTLPVAVGPVS
jgi:two-component system NtrC family sensor kinase